MIRRQWRWKHMLVSIVCLLCFYPACMYFLIIKAPDKRVVSHSQKVISAFVYVPPTLRDAINLPSFDSESATYAQQEYNRLRCLHAIRANISSTHKHLFQKINKTALLFVATHNNLGDNILFLGGVRLAESHGHALFLVCQGRVNYQKPGFPNCPATPAELLNKLGNNSLILLHAGGNWGSLWPIEHHPRMKFLAELGALIKARHLTITIVQLPQSIWYNNTDAATLDSDKATLRKLPHSSFHLFTRQRDSFNFAKSVYSGTPLGVSPDLAFLLPPSLPLSRPIVDVLFLLREDKERASTVSAHPSTLASAVLTPLGLRFKIMDWPSPSPYAAYEVEAATPVQFAEIRWRLINEILSQGVVVVTDRLHASIGCILLGRRHIALDNNYRKLTMTQKFAFSVSSQCSPANLQIQYAEDLRQALEMAVAILETPFLYN